MTKVKIMAAVILMLLGIPLGYAQRASFKTNLIYDAAFLSPNLGVEVGLAPKWTLDVSGNLNFWTVNGHKWRHWLVQPEARYWFCRRFQGHFLGLHAIGGEFNFGNIDNGIHFLGTDLRPLKDRRYEGWGQAPASATATTGSSTATGTSRQKSESAGYMRATTCTRAPSAAASSAQATTTTSARQRWPST